MTNKHDMADIGLLQFTWLGKGEPLLRNEPPPKKNRPRWGWWPCKDDAYEGDYDTPTQHINQPRPYIEVDISNYLIDQYFPKGEGEE